MRLLAGMFALVFVLAAVAEVRGQVVVVHVPLESGWFNGKGWGVQYKNRNLALSAYYASGGYGYSGPPFALGPYGPVPPVPAYYVVPPPPFVTGAVTGRAPVNYYAPAPMARPAWRSETEGIDLDQLTPRKPPPREDPAPAPPPKPPEKEPELPGVDVSKPKLPERPRDGEPGAHVPPPRELLPPEPAKDRPKDLTARLIDLGLEAFAMQEYGLAAKRFRQVSLIDPKLSLARFLLAQAHLALDKYDESVTEIDAGLRLHKTWPTVPFHPRVELYQANEADFVAHLKRLEEVIGTKANAELLFLYAYQLWFDGRRADAAAVFRRARDLTRATANIDRFLAAAPPVAFK